MSGWPSRRYAIIPELHIFSRQNNLLEASQQWECHSPSLPLPRCVCVWDRGKCSAMSVYSKLQAQQFTTHVQRGKKGREKKRQARWFSSRLYINHTGTYIVLDCQEKKIVPLTALTPTSYPSSSSLYYHHLSAYLFIHLSIQPTSHPSFFPILPNGAVHGCMIETHAAEHHFWFYGPDFRRGGGKGLKKTEAMADLLLAH